MPKARQEETADESGRSPEAGDTVVIEYTGTLPNGRVFDKATPENPFSFTIGANQALPALEFVIKGMKIGETKTFTLNPMEAYGIWREDLVITVERNTFPAHEQIEVGKRAKVAFSGGSEQVMKVIEITDAGIKMDGNHPLAGYPLTFHNVTLKEIE